MTTGRINQDAILGIGVVDTLGINYHSNRSEFD